SNQSILHSPQCHFVLHLFGMKSGVSFSDNKTLYLVVIQISCPDDSNVGKGSVSNPLFLSIDNPPVRLSFTSGGESSCRSRANFGFGESKCTYHFHLLHFGQPLLLLFS